MTILFIDKPKGITSFDVCYKLRKALKTRCIGHSGTLDPNASGVMIIASDKDTKALQFLKSDVKEYIGTCVLGIKTDTLDIDGKIIEKIDNPKVLTEDELNTTFNKFIGKFKQRPPMYSAVHFDGKRLYELARENKHVDVKERDIEVFNIELLDIQESSFTFKCLVSSGTYIRVLLEDILSDLNTIGVLSELKRTKSGKVLIEECDSLDNVLNGKYKSYSVFELLKKYYYIYNTNNMDDIKAGKSIVDSSLEEDYLLVCSDNEAIAVYKKDNKKYTCVRGLF